MYEITKVDFSMGGDGRTALYIDDKKVKEGDHYHDKIDQFIEGFIFALDQMNIDYKYDSITAIEENKTAWGIYEDGDVIPVELERFDEP